MKILVAVPRFDYGRREWGDSYEYVAFVGPLKSLGHQVDHFDTFDERWARDRDAAGRALLNRVRDEAPDVVLTMLMSDELPLDAIRSVGRMATTMNWFADDEWRFHSHTRYAAPSFHWSITTSKRALRWYDALPSTRAVFAPWGFNPDVFHPVETPLIHDVAFIGQRHGVRAKLIERLRSDGISVFVRGANWPGGRVAVQEMAQTFASARVNLSFLASSAGPIQRAGWKFRGGYRLDQTLIRVVAPPLQMKARLVEVPASGGFQLSDDIPELHSMFDVGREVGAAKGYEGFRRAIEYYLANDDERSAMAARACARAHEEHTFQIRFTQLFDAMGLA